MFEREQHIAFSGRCHIGDPEVCFNFKKKDFNILLKFIFCRKRVEFY